MTKLYLVWILWVYTGKEIDVMCTHATPKSTEAEGEIAIFGYGYPIADDIYDVVAVFLAVFCIRSE